MTRQCRTLDSCHAMFASDKSETQGFIARGYKAN